MVRDFAIQRALFVFVEGERGDNNKVRARYFSKLFTLLMDFSTPHCGKNESSHKNIAGVLLKSR